MNNTDTVQENENEQIGKVDIPSPSGVFSEPWSVKKLSGLLAVFGPAAIVASVSIGAGETIVVVRTGAWAGYGLLWLVLLSCVVKGVFVTYLLGRYTAVSGEYIGHRLVRLPGPRGWLLIVIMAMEMIGAPLAWVPIAKPCGDLFHFLIQGALPNSLSEPIWENIFTSAFIALALAFGLRLSFERLERQQLVICTILVAGTIIGTLMVRPDFGKAVVGSLRFGDLPPFPSWAPEDAIKNPLLTMATAFGYVGGSVMGYTVYANWVGMHRWGLTGHQKIAAIRQYAFTHDAIDYLPDDPEQVSRLRKIVAPLRWDVGMGAIVLFIVTGAFMLSGAAVLYPLKTRFDGWSLLTNQAHVWSNIHASLVWVYYVSIVAALWGTLQALPEIYARVTQEFFQAIWPRGSRSSFLQLFPFSLILPLWIPLRFFRGSGNAEEWDYNRIRRNACLYIFLTTMIIVWLNIPFDILTQIAGFILANFSIALMMLGALYLNFKLPAAYRTRIYMLIGTVISAGILILFAGISGWGLIGKLFGSG
ncbi:MAG: Nramp family divalent metal transporter [Candidatus Poribacteria bacterium]|nr:Nramp family divalent metal transporter [Candidatus Poribacteria bacterium]